jgi:small subunit ribosomal protein S16
LSVKIRLKRIGKRKQPFYRIVVMDTRAKRDGKAIDDLGFYQPWLKTKKVQIDLERYSDWIRKGALPSETIRTVFKNLKKGATA